MLLLLSLHMVMHGKRTVITLHCSHCHCVAHANSHVDWSKHVEFSFIFIFFFVGVSAEALQLADSTAYIPMSGFVSSFNVSVAAALVFYEARRARLAQLGHHSDLSDHEKQVLMAVMLLRHQVSLQTQNRSLFSFHGKCPFDRLLCTNACPTADGLHT